MANINISRILMKRGNTAAASTYVGPLGELVVDTGLKTVRIQDGATAGGMAVLATLTGLNQISGNVANLQTTTANIRANLSAFQTYANTTFGTSNYGNANVAAYLTTHPQSGLYGNANVAALLGAFGSNNISTTGTANIGSVNMSSGITWGGGSQVYEDTVLVAQGAVAVALTSPGETTITAGTNTWQFDSTGTLTLPQGGVIAEGASPTGVGSTITLKPNGGSSTQALLIYPTAAGDGDHVHLTAGGGSTELYLGNDLHYVKLVDGGNIEIRTDDLLGNVGTWNFGAGGTTTIPGPIVTQYGTIESGTIGPGVTIMANVDAGQYFNGLFVGNTDNRQQHYLYASSGQVVIGVTDTGINQNYEWTFNSDASLNAPGGLNLAGNINFTASPAGAITGASLVSAQEFYSSGNVTIGGNLVINGNATTVGTRNLIIDDNIIYMANANPANSLDIGFAGHFNNGTYQHTGLVRQASTGQWKLFSNIAAEPGNTLDFANAVYDAIQVGAISSPTITDLYSNAAVQSANIAALVANAGVQADAITSLTANAGVQSANIATLVANAASQATDITTLYANAGAQSNSIAGANAAIVTANTAMKSYVDAVTTAWTANAATQQGLIAALQSNAATQDTSINSINANIGSYYTWANANVSGLYNSILGANANAVAQQTAINSINANIGGFYTYANLNYGTSSYANANVAAYLPTYSGNVQASSLIVSTSIIATGASPAPVISGFGSISTTGSAVNEGNITASGNLVASRGVFVVGNVTAAQYNFANGVNILSTIAPSSTYSNANIVANLQNYVTSINTTANITTTANMISPNYLFANGVNILSTITPSSSYSNTNVAAYLTTQTFYSNANVVANLQNYVTTISTTANIATTANIIAPNYLFANGVNILSTIAPSSTYSNANIVANLSNYVTNIVSTANITAGNLIGTQYGNTIGTTGTFTGNVSANYFVGNGSALTGLTYNSVGNIYGSSSNVTLQAGSYSWTFDNTGNLVIPTTSNIVYANGTVFSSGSGSGGTTYSNANVVSMLAANTYLALGNVVTTYPTLANITTIFVGNNTTITGGGGTTPSATHILNNAYFGSNGAMYARNTYASGVGQFYIDGGNFYWNAQSTATANAVAGLGSRMSLTGTTLATFNGTVFNSAGLITAAGGMSVTSSTGITTNQATIPLFNTAATTINFGGVATTINMGQSTPGTSSNIFVGNTIGTQTGNLTVRARGQYNYTTQYGVAGGYNSPPYTAQSLTGGSGTGMTATYSSTGGYVSFPITIVNPGTGYKNGDVLTLPGGLGATAQIWNYNSNYVGQTGQSDITFTIDGNLILPGGLSLPANSSVTGDFSNSTFNYRTVFRTTTANATTGIYAVPSGTGTGAAWQAANSSNIANTSKIMITTNGSTDVQLVSGINGTGTYLPLSFLTNGSTQMQLGTAGNLLMVTGGNISTTGNVIAGNIVANQYGNSVGTTATYSGNVTAAYFVGNVVSSGPTNLVGNVSTGNLTVSGNLISTGYGFFPGAFDENSTSSGVFLGNTNTTPRIGFYNGNTSQNWQIDNSGGQFRWYTPGITRMYLEANGNLTVTGNLTISGTLNTSISSNVVISGNAGVISPNLTAFRVIGQGGSIGLNANLTASNWTVDYTQGFASTSLNGTTGIFTAPMAGLYSSTLTARTTSNSYASIIQACIMQRKAGIATVAMMIEWGANTTMNHASGGTTVKLAQGDQLWVQCLANGGGTGFSFDGNDHWDVTYLG